MAASKEESVISLSIDEDIDKTNDSSHNNQNISDFEGKVILESSIERNGPLGITEESTAGVCYMFQQNEKKITEKREDVLNVITQASTSVDQTTSPNERNISTAESCSDESRKAHTYKEEASLIQSTKLPCELCSTDEEHVEATQFCKTCNDPEPLCEMCAKHHLRQTLSKNHEMCADMEQFRNKRKTESLNQSTQLFCELCSTDEENVGATQFCKTCVDPDPLCEMCAKHHLKQKLSKNHEICADIKRFIKKKGKECLNQSTKLLCELCSTDEEHVEATHFCKTCDDPDPLCGMCAKHHLKQKLSKNHEMCEDLNQFPNKNKTESLNQSTKLLCELCSTDEENVEATQFCKTCDEPDPLCGMCAKHHLRQKLSKNHEMSADIEQFPNRGKTESLDQSTKLLCELCSTDEENVEATHFCKTCDEPDPLCGICAKHHLRQKFSKNHEMCADIEQFPNKRKTESLNLSTKLLCELCCTDEEHAEATHFCKTCNDPDPLCGMCAKHHLRQKLSKNHEMCANIEEFPNKEKTECSREGTETKKTQSKYFPSKENNYDREEMCSSKDESFNTENEKFKNHEEKKYESKALNARENDMGKKMLCEPCSYEGSKIQSTHFCETCDDPEPFCDACAKNHTKQKISKHHKLSKNMQDFTKRENVMEKNILCEPCSSEGLQVQASHFCETCDDPEPLCNVCAKNHTKQKISKHHRLSKNIQDFKGREKANMEMLFCEPCFSENLQIQATHFCKTCDDPEPLCDSCAKYHTKQKLSKNHELSGDIREFQKMYQNIIVKDLLCGPCSTENKSILATFFCKTCDDPEPFCDICAKNHTKQKLTKNHEICENLKDFQKSEKWNGKDILCEPCSTENKHILASSYCRTCDDPELLCDTCARHHTKQKLSKNHELCGNVNEFQKSYANKPKKPAKDDKTPGKPSSTEINSNSLTLVWDKSVKKVTHYQVRYKCSNKDEKWKFSETDSSQNFLVITGLMAKTEYMFQVRGVFEDVEGPYSPVSDIIETRESLATHILGFCKMLKDARPSKYLLPAEENIKARNENARTRQLIFGKPPPVLHEKTILLVGATGSGKSTLVDAFVNYITGVSYDDPFRFTTIMLDENEEMKTHNQAVSQTEWITVYKLHPKIGSRLNYTLNIIDTPGFGDTRGIQRDNAIVDQIRHLFCSQGEDGVLYIDAVCFIVKAPDARLTVLQKYIFGSIMSLFGKDIESNICTLITFADGAEPPVLASLKESKLPHETTFTFNNSALFAENEGLANNTLSPMFWEMGCRSLQRFFKYIKDLKAASLSQTKDVLEEREQLKCVISNIQPQITMGLSKLSELRQKVEIFQRNKSEIENNQNFEYTVEETKQQLIELVPGQHVTNCLHCNVTCHEECKIPDDAQKKRCMAMDKEGNCRICPGKCVWTEHKNTPYVIKCVIEKVTKTYAEMKDRYEKAIGQTVTHEKYIEDLTYCVENTFEEIKHMMDDMNRCKSRLKEIALRPDPLSAVEHIDLLIQSEQEEKQPGHENRVKMLKEFKKSAQLAEEVEKLGKNIQDARENTKSVTGKSFGRENDKKKTKNYLSRGYQYLKTLF